MQRDGIVDLRANAHPAEVCTQCVALRDANDVLVVDVPSVRYRVRRPDDFSQVLMIELSVIVRGVALAPIGPLVKIAKLDQQDRGLNLIQAKIAADDGVVILGVASMRAQNL